MDNFKLDNNTDWLPMRQAVTNTLLHQNNDDYSTELDPKVFHPSAAGKCKRQIFLSKLGQNFYSAETQGKFAVGTAIHEWIEEHLADYLETQEHIDNDPQFETDVTFEDQGIKIKGRADFYDGHTVTDFKTRAGWYHFDLPVQRHVDQVLMYMKGLDADGGRLLYLRKKDMDMRTYPSDSGVPFFSFDRERYNEIIHKLQQVRDKVAERIENREEGDYVRSMDDIPFDNCGECYPCRKENEQTYEFMRDNEDKVNE